jgi:F-type H+-transporting ATPase subunit b
MPQFDFTTYLSQLFWFSICFAILYFFVAFIILPRIKAIISARFNIIDTDNSIALELENNSKSINKEAEITLQKANAEYISKIDEITKISLENRDKSLEKLKKEIDIKVQNSRQEIKKFIENSQNNNFKIINELEQLIKNKITN